MGLYEFGTGFSTGSVWDWYGFGMGMVWALFEVCYMGFVGGINY